MYIYLDINKSHYYYRHYLNYKANLGAYRWEDGFPPLPLYPFPPCYIPVPTTAQPGMSESCRLKDSEES